MSIAQKSNREASSTADMIGILQREQHLAENSIMTGVCNAEMQRWFAEDERRITAVDAVAASIRQSIGDAEMELLLEADPEDGRVSLVFQIGSQLEYGDAMQRLKRVWSEILPSLDFQVRRHFVFVVK